MRFEQLADPIELPDNSGRDCARLRPCQANADHFLADVELTSEAVDEDGVPLPQCRLQLQAMPIPRAALAELSAALAQWFTQQHSFAVPLAQSGWGRLELAVGPDPQYITSAQKPACRFTYKWYRISGDFVLIADQSCLRIFHQGIDGWLRLRDNHLSP